MNFINKYLEPAMLNTPTVLSGFNYVLDSAIIVAASY
jgi:hypothetical protein